MLIRPPVVRQMRRDMWAQMTGWSNIRPTNTTVPRAQGGSGTKPDRLAQLAELAELRNQGTLSEEEFQREKRRLLESG